MQELYLHACRAVVRFTTASITVTLTLTPVSFLLSSRARWMACLRDRLSSCSCRCPSASWTYFVQLRIALPSTPPPPPSLSLFPYATRTPSRHAGFTIVGKPHGITTSSGPNRPRFPSLARHLIPSPLTPFPSPVPGFGQCRPNLRRSGPRLNTAMGGNRPGGYGRFDDAENEPSVRGYAPPPPPPPSARQEEETRRGGWEEGSRRSGGREGGREWEEIGNADVLVPKGLEYPLGVVHFVGGQGVGVFPKNAYGTLLEALADAGVYV